MLLLIILGILLDFTPPSRALYMKMNMPPITWPEQYSSVQFNIDATYAYVYRLAKGQYISSLVHLSDRHIYNLPEQDSIIECRWLDKSVLLIANIERDTARHPGMQSLTLWQWRDTVARSCYIANAGSYPMRYSAISPDEQRVLIGGYDELLFCDLTTGLSRTLVKANKAKLSRLSEQEPYKQHGLYQCWWQANNVAGYLDPLTGKRRLLAVSPLHITAENTHD